MSNKIIPITYKPEMVRAILDDRKTMTRRLPNKQNSECETSKLSLLDFSQATVCFAGSDHAYMKVLRPADGTWHRVFYRAEPGDVLWVRENWKIVGWDFEEPMMRISYQEGGIQNCEVHDPTEDSMWLLNQVEALENGGYIEQDPEDKSRYRFTTKEQPWRPSIHMPKEACRLWLKVKAVRVERLWDISEEDAMAEGAEKAFDVYKEHARYKLGFNRIWEKINGIESLEANPWVWVIEFERCEMPAGFLTRKTAGR